jgi:UDPglucose 6-dehydrogenase
VGLVTSACLAYLGNRVIAVDSNKSRLDSLRAGKSPFYEPGLDNFLKDAIQSGNLEFSENIEHAVVNSQVIFIAVGTPPMPNGEPDLSQVMAVARSIGAALDNSKQRVIVNKSTVPVGSGNWVDMLVNQGVQAVQAVPARAANRASGPAFSVVSNPEFLREGSAIFDSFYPDRIVLGAADDFAIRLMKDLYHPILVQSFNPPAYAPRPAALEEVPFLVTDVPSAEMIKYAANAFLAMKISFANEISGLCELVGADIRQIVKGIGFDKRIGERFLNAGVGWGGSCFGKDVSALMQVAQEYSYPTPLLQATVSVNERQRLMVVKKLQQELKIIKGRTISLMGLSFKPNTDDLRDAPSLTIAKSLVKMGATVKVYDPMSNEVCKELNPGLDVIYSESLQGLASASDALVLVTEWEEFKQADWASLARAMRYPLVIDGRNVLPELDILEAGLIYRGIGH